MDGPFAQPLPRPYYIPASIDYDSLPAAVRQSFAAVVQPTYEELVLGAATPLARSAGVSLGFLLCVEILEQFELGRLLNYTGAAAEADAADRDRLIARHLRLVGAKQHCASFLLRLETLRAGQARPTAAS